MFDAIKNYRSMVEYRKVAFFNHLIFAKKQNAEM